MFHSENSESTRYVFRKSISIIFELEHWVVLRFAVNFLFDFGAFTGQQLK
jgi:hypothetical protein